MWRFVRLFVRVFNAHLSVLLKVGVSRVLSVEPRVALAAQAQSARAAPQREVGQIREVMLLREDMY